MAYTAAKAVAIAAAEVGYHEKASNASLDNKTANSGGNNYTKYARDLYAAGYYNGNKQGVAWCDMFFDWCIYQLCDKNKARAEAMQYQTGNLGAGCVYSAGYYKTAKRWVTKNPQPGDQIFFLDSDGEEGHTGMVEKVTDQYVYTIEGNANNQVMRKTYALTDKSIAGYGRPKYETEAATQTTAPATTQPTAKTTTSNGKKEYGKGIDVSGWNGTIDWAKVKASGIGFAIIKMGNIYESKGTVDLESTFRSNVAACEKIGLPYGVYVYTYVKTQARMREVMPYVAAELKNTCKKMKRIPCYLDIEELAVVSGGNNNTLAMAKIFMNAVEGAGYAAGIYSSTSWWNTYLTSPWYHTKAKWVADWGSKCDYTGSYGIWQYSENGRVNGITGNVDMNIAYFDFSNTSTPATPEKKTLTDKEQIYTIKSGDTWAKVAELYGLNGVKGGIALLEYNNYANANNTLVYKIITQKTIKIPAKWIPGDVDGDGKVTAADARKALRASAKLTTLSPAEFMRADYESDGKVTAADARTILRVSANLKK